MVIIFAKKLNVTNNKKAFYFIPSLRINYFQHNKNSHESTEILTIAMESETKYNASPDKETTKLTKLRIVTKLIKQISSNNNIKMKAKQ